MVKNVKEGMSKKKYQPLTIPRLSWKRETLTSAFGELVAQPLDPGFGITLGNALRRILLGGVEGAAVTAVIIKGVNNEFSALEGVIEDAMQVILNIKELVVKNSTGEPGKMSLKVKGEAVARASDIVADEHLEVINTDHVIAHVSANGILEIEFFVESGRGYQPARWPVGQALQEDNRIYLDAMFSPVRKVTFDVEKTRVGGEIDYDKLTLGIVTDGSETPVDVMHYSVSVLRTQLEHFLLASEIPFNEISAAPQEEEQQEQSDTEESVLKGIPVELLLKPIDELELSVRAHNCLINAGIKRIIDLVNLSDDEALKIKNFGRKSLNEVKDSLKSFGLSFGMNIKESDIKKVLESREVGL
jgi:DNA-directed RNA polymerase subunit alpha